LRYLKIFCLLFLIILFSNCAYYNTFYNARKLFREAQEIGYDDQGRPKSTAIQKYNNTIKKCGVILTDYKNSKWADDALFLLARSFYYKGNSYTIAIEKFNDLIKFYPESKYVQDAQIYIAKANFKFNNKTLAYEQLKSFIKDSQNKAFHSKAKLVLANYYLEDNDKVEANYYYQSIIEKFPKSDEYQEAFFQQAKTLHISGNYLSSNQVFLDLLEAKVEKKIKLDARYYIALNFLMLENYEQSYKIIKKLLKDEFRTAVIPKIKLLEARCLSEMKDIEQAVEIIQNIKKENKNTLLAAEASYFLGEIYFTKLQDYEKAIEAYSDVNKENKKSEYVEKAVSRSSVIGEIIQYNNPEKNIPTRDLVTQKMKLAEYYIEELNMPDSALAVYDNIITDPQILKEKLNNLLNIKNGLPDSILTAAKLDSSGFYIDSLSVQTDSLQIGSTAIDTTESIYIQESDTLKAVSISELNEMIEKNQTDIAEYETEYVPFARFVKVWIYSTILKDSVKAIETYNVMQVESPLNQYTLAANSIIIGEKAELLEAKFKLDRQEYEQAFIKFTSHPDSSYIDLMNIAENSEHHYYTKANYTLGYYNYLTLKDTASARTFFDRILNEESSSEYKTEILKIYNGENFLFSERLDYFVNKSTEEDSLISTTPAEIDSLSTEIYADSLSQDSILITTPAKILSKQDPAAPHTIEVPKEPISIEIEILADGTPANVTILDDNLIRTDELQKLIFLTVRSWKFQPALINNIPVYSKIQDQITFKFE
jgi:TolA-binding protein